MEMENNALSRITDMQTNILEEIREIRRREEMRQNTENMKNGIPTSMNVDPSHISPVTGTSPNDIKSLADLTEMNQQESSMFIPEEHYPSQDLLGYESPLTYSAASQFGGRYTEEEVKEKMKVLMNKQYSGIKTTAGSVIEDFAGLDMMSMSSEDIAKHLGRRSQGIEELSADIMGGAMSLTGAVAGFGLPLFLGTGVGAGVGFAANEFVKGSKEALGYQDILLEDGHKAFNFFQSTGDYGSLGIGREDRQDLSKDIRHLAVNEFLEDDEISGILQGSLDYKLLRTAQDTETFKNKFTEIVKTTKHVAATLGTSLEEAQEVMDEMNRKGIGMQEMNNLTSQSKIAASFTGEDGIDVLKRNIQVSGEMVAGTSINSGDIMHGIGYGTSVISTIEQRASQSGDQDLVNYIKNAGGLEKVPAEIERERMEYFKDEGATNLVALYGDAFELDDEGNWRLNKDTLRDILDSGETGRVRLSKAAANTKTYSADELEKLTREAQNAAYLDLNETERNKLILGINENFQETAGITEEQAYYHMGLTSEQDREALKLRKLFYEVGTDERAVSQFDNAAIQESLDSSYRQDNPDLIKRMRFGIKKAIGLPIGDLGQSATQGIGNFFHTTTADAITQMTDKERSELMSDRNLSKEELEKSMDDLPELLEKSGVDVGDVEIDIEDIENKKKRYDSSRYSELIDSAKYNNLSFEELERLEEETQSENTSLVRRAQSKHIHRVATGESNLLDKMLSPALRVGSWFGGEGKSSAKGKGFNPAKDLDKRKEEIRKELEEKEKELRSEIANKNISAEEKDEIWDVITAYKIGEDVDLDSLDSKIGGKTFSDYKKIMEQSDYAKSANDLILGDNLSIEASLNASGNVYQLLKNSGAISDEEYSAYYYSREKRMKGNIKKDIKNLDKMDVSERYQVYDRYRDEFEEEMERVGEEGRLRTAEFLAESSPTMNLEDFFEEGRISTDKLFEASQKISKTSYEGTSAVDEILDASGMLMSDSASGFGKATKEVATAIEGSNEALMEVAAQTEESLSVVYDSLRAIEQNKTDYMTSRMGR